MSPRLVTATRFGSGSPTHTGRKEPSDRPHGGETARTWSQLVLEVGDQLVLLQNQLPVQVRDGQIRESAQALDHKLLLFIVGDLGCQVPDIILDETEFQHEFSDF